MRIRCDERQEVIWTVSEYLGRQLGQAHNRRRLGRGGRAIVGLRRVEGEANGLKPSFRTGAALISEHVLEFERFRGGPYFGFTIFRAPAILLSGVQVDVTSRRGPTDRERMRLTPLKEIYRAQSDVGELELALESASLEWVLPMLTATD